ncbi:MAG: FHA domain-containing protein, partial [Pseudomonadota bacterium]
QFFLQHGGGKGVTYLNGSALLEPTTLESGDRILLGATELLFRPLVGEDFDWSSHGTSAPAP